MLDALEAPPLPLQKSAARDLIDGAAHVDLWARLGWLEVKRRYRRTTLGPFWSVISLAALVISIGTVGAALWRQDPFVYMPYLTAGMVAWITISTTLGEACGVLLAGSNLITNARCDFSVLTYALVWRNLLVFLHHLLVYALIMLALAPHLLSPAAVLLLPNVALLVLNGIWITLLLGMACLRFRDVQQIVTSMLPIGMIVTPIFWPIDQVAGTARMVFVQFNPLYHCVQMVRAPLLGTVPSASNYIVVLAMAAVGWTVALLVFARFRARIAYWS